MESSEQQQLRWFSRKLRERVLLKNSCSIDHQHDKTIADHQPLTTANDKTIADHQPLTTANDNPGPQQMIRQWEDLLRRSAEKICWEDLLRRSAEKICWDLLRKSAERKSAEKICWEDLLKKSAEKICWENLLRENLLRRSAEKICWRKSAAKICGEDLLKKSAEKICWEEICWEDLLRRSAERKSAEKICWEDLLKKICWEDLLRRSAEKICWEDLLRMVVDQDFFKNSFFLRRVGLVDQDGRPPSRRFVLIGRPKLRWNANFVRRRALRARRTSKTVVKCEFCTSPRNPLVTSCSSDVQNCGEMQIF